MEDLLIIIGDQQVTIRRLQFQIDSMAEEIKKLQDENEQLKTEEVDK